MQEYGNETCQYAWKHVAPIKLCSNKNCNEQDKINRKIIWNIYLRSSNLPHIFRFAIPLFTLYLCARFCTGCYFIYAVCDTMHSVIGAKKHETTLSRTLIINFYYVLIYRIFIILIKLLRTICINAVIIYEHLFRMTFSPKALCMRWEWDWNISITVEIEVEKETGVKVKLAKSYQMGDQLHTNSLRHLIILSEMRFV